jgi:hypothetical protein
MLSDSRADQIYFFLVYCSVNLLTLEPEQRVFGIWNSGRRGISWDHGSVQPSSKVLPLPVGLVPACL